MLDQIWFPLSITLWIAAVSSFLVLCSGVVIAYIFARRDFRGKELAELFVTLPLILPPTVIGYLLVILVGKNGFFGQLIYNVLGTGIPIYLAGCSHCGLYGFPSSYGENRTGSY